MIGEIKIVFDDSKNQVGVSAPMANQEQKNYTIKKLLAAISIVMDFQPTLITPAKALPTNGNIPLKVTH